MAVGVIGGGLLDHYIISDNHDYSKDITEINTNQDTMMKTINDINTRINIVENKINENNKKIYDDICALHGELAIIEKELLVYSTVKDFLEKIENALYTFERSEVPKGTRLYQTLYQMCLAKNYINDDHKEQYIKVCKLITDLTDVKLIKIHVERQPQLNYKIRVVINANIPFFKLFDTVVSQMDPIAFPHYQMMNDSNKYYYTRLDIPKMIFTVNNTDYHIDGNICKNTQFGVLCQENLWQSFDLKTRCNGEKDHSCKGEIYEEKFSCLVKRINNIVMISSNQETTAVKLVDQKNQLKENDGLYKKFNIGVNYLVVNNSVNASNSFFPVSLINILCNSVLFFRSTFLNSLI